jgi:hypothetical protein
LKDFNPNDLERQQREDPMMAFMCSSSGSAARPSQGGLEMKTSAMFVDENGDSDPEAEFLSSLSRREKKLLLRKLQVIIAQRREGKVAIEPSLH